MPAPSIKDGLKLRTQGRLRESLALFQRLAKADPANPKVAYQCAWAHDLLGMERDAIPHYERAVARGLTGAELEGAFIGLGSSYRCVGNAAKSVRLLRQAGRRFPKSRPIQVFLALALRDQGKGREAVSILVHQLMTTTSDKELAKYRRALLHYAEEQPGKKAQEQLPGTALSTPALLS